MEYAFDYSLVSGYNSASQKVRIMSEAWVAQNVYCPVCGNPRIAHLDNNLPVADFQCDYCGEIYELKSKNGKLGHKISDGAYATMLSRITSISNPNLFVMEYTNDWQVNNLAIVPKFFFTPEIIEQRKPLTPTARRAGWVGCNILYSEIPIQGRISIIKEQHICNKQDVVDAYKTIKNIQTNNMASRCWIFDVLNCINDIDSKIFTLSDVYEYVDILQQKHLDNHNVEAKIRQQLQFLRDKGIIAFIAKGQYQKIIG